MSDYDLTISEVSKIADCHINTVKNYEAKGFIKSMRDANNFRRYRRQDAIRLREVIELRRPDSKV